MFVENIEDEIIRWLQDDKKAAEYALYWSKPEFKDERSRHLSDMIEDKFQGLRIPRPNIVTGETGIYLSVIQDAWSILPKILSHKLFNNILLTLVSDKDKQRFKDSYPSEGPGGWLINESVKNDYEWKKWLLNVFQLYKHYYDSVAVESVELIHYIDISKPVELNESFSAFSSAGDMLPDKILTRW